MTAQGKWCKYLESFVSFPELLIRRSKNHLVLAYYCYQALLFQLINTNNTICQISNFGSSFKTVTKQHGLEFFSNSRKPTLISPPTHQKGLHVWISDIISNYNLRNSFLFLIINMPHVYKYLQINCKLLPELLTLPKIGDNVV